ncbi:MAG: HEAT repeat domain-containing protein, partial [Phycisphaerales bacterium]|nr:HEAT repeat domain-containing protein [Phycisphaerales bacterium]
MTGITRYCILAITLAACPVLAADGPEPMHPKRLRLAMYPYLRGRLTEARVAEGRRIASELTSIQSAWDDAKTTTAQRAELNRRLNLLAATLKNTPAIRTNPYDAQVDANLKMMKAAKEPRRIRAIEALGYLRAYRCAGEVARLMSDKSVGVRRQAAETLAWIGGRAEIPVLLAAFGDLDWVVRQGACAALQNITAMELPLDALADKETQRKQIAAWRQWARSLRPGLLPAELVKLAASDDYEDRLRAVRAAGSLGGAGASKLVAKTLRASEPDKTAARNLVNVFAPAASRNQTPFTIMQAGLRSLGRLRQPEGLPVLGEYLGKIQFTRYAADGLGEYGGDEATRALLEAADRCVPGLKGPFQRATDDVEWPANPLSTAFAIYSALLRLSVEGQDVIRLVEIAHGAVGQVRKQNDRGVFYKPEVTRVVARYILEMTGLRRICVREVFKSLGVADKRDELLPAPGSIKRLAAAYKDELLPGFCEPSDGPTLIKLLTHDSNRVRIMACKALMFADAKDTVGPIARLLAASKPEADYGFVRDFLLDPHRDPPGRWRGTFARALGALGGDDQVPLLATIMNDTRSVLDVRYAAARALADIDTPRAVAALKPAAKSHDFHNIRLLA